jgi:hypothetical protein
MDAAEIEEDPPPKDERNEVAAAELASTSLVYFK